MDAFRSSKSGEASPTDAGADLCLSRLYVSVAARVDAGGRGGVVRVPRGAVPAPLLGRQQPRFVATKAAARPRAAQFLAAVPAGCRGNRPAPVNAHRPGPGGSRLPWR